MFSISSNYRYSFVKIFQTSAMNIWLRYLCRPASCVLYLSYNILFLQLSLGISFTHKSCFFMFLCIRNFPTIITIYNGFPIGIGFKRCNSKVFLYIWRKEDITFIEKFCFCFVRKFFNYYLYIGWKKTFFNTFDCSIIWPGYNKDMIRTLTRFPV